MTWWQGGGVGPGGVLIPPKSDDVIYEQSLIPSPPSSFSSPSPTTLSLWLYPAKTPPIIPTLSSSSDSQPMIITYLVSTSRLRGNWPRWEEAQSRCRTWRSPGEIFYQESFRHCRCSCRCNSLRGQIRPSVRPIPSHCTMVPLSTRMLLYAKFDMYFRQLLQEHISRN